MSSIFFYNFFKFASIRSALVSGHSAVSFMAQSESWRRYGEPRVQEFWQSMALAVLRRGDDDGSEAGPVSNQTSPFTPSRSAGSVQCSGVRPLPFMVRKPDAFTPSTEAVWNEPPLPSNRKPGTFCPSCTIRMIVHQGPEHLKRIRHCQAAEMRFSASAMRSSPEISLGRSASRRSARFCCSRTDAMIRATNGSATSLKASKI